MEGIEAGRTGGISLPPERYNGQSIRRWSRGLGGVEEIYTTKTRLNLQDFSFQGVEIRYPLTTIFSLTNPITCITGRCTTGKKQSQRPRQTMIV